MATSVGTAIFDVYGTLWPEGWTSAPHFRESSMRSLRRALPSIELDVVRKIQDDLADEAVALYGSIEQDTLGRIDAVLRRYGQEPNERLVGEVCDALVQPVKDNVQLFPGAIDAMLALRAHGVHRVAISNAIWRSGAQYVRDFDDLGIGTLIEAAISSVDVGFRKPHSAMFLAGLAAVGAEPEESVLIGDSEEHDLVPAHGLGLRTILVAIGRPLPVSTSADRTATSLNEVAEIILSWQR